MHSRHAIPTLTLLLDPRVEVCFECSCLCVSPFYVALALPIPTDTRFSLSQSSLQQTGQTREEIYCFFFFFCPETYKIFPDFIYLSHTPGRSFHGRQQMIINGLLPPSKLRISSGMLHSENGLDKLSYGRKLQLHNWKKVKEFL